MAARDAQEVRPMSSDRDETQNTTSPDEADLERERY